MFKVVYGEIRKRYWILHWLFKVDYKDARLTSTIAVLVGLMLILSSYFPADGSHYVNKRQIKATLSGTLDLKVRLSQPAFTCSNSTMETSEQCVNSV